MQLNICGVSNHSKLALTQYFDQCSPRIVALNETKQDLKIDSFTNYRTESAIRQNKSEGVAILIHNSLHSTRISSKVTDFDNIWLITAIGGNKVLVITCYIRPDDFMYIEQFTKMIMDAEEFVETHQLDGIMFMGHLNARHETWGDSVTNRKGRLLIEQLSVEFLILNNGQPTYLCTNGYSVMDLIFLYEKIADASWNLFTDADVELFTGAPNRGHIPVFAEWTYINKSKPAIKRPWLGKADWQSWTEFIEIKINSIECNTASELWNAM